MRSPKRWRKGRPLSPARRRSAAGWWLAPLVAAGCAGSGPGPVAAPGATASIDASSEAGGAVRLRITVLRPGPPVDAVRLGRRIVVASEGSLRIAGDPSGTGAVAVAPPGSIVVDLWTPAADADRAAGAVDVPGGNDAHVLFAALDPPAIVRLELAPTTDGGLEVTSRETIAWPAGAGGAGGRGDCLTRWDDHLVVLTADGAWSRPLAGGPWTRRLASDAPAESVVGTARGPVVTAGRRAWSFDDGTFAGSASRLLPVPPGTGWPATFAALRRPPAGVPDGRSEIVAMDGGLREVARDRWRSRWTGRITQMAFDRGVLVVETEDLIARLGPVDLAGDPIRSPTLAVTGEWPRPAGTRLVAFGPNEAVVLGGDGRIHPVPVRRGTVAAWAAVPPAGPPDAVAFDGRTIRLWSGGRDGAGTVDVGLDGTVRAARRAGAADPRSAPRLGRSIATGRGTVRCVGAPDGPDAAEAEPPGAAAIVRVEGTGGIAAGGRAWIATRDGLAVHDPADGRRLAAASIDGRVVWMHALSGGRGIAAVTDRGTVLLARLPRRTAVAGG